MNQEVAVLLASHGDFAKAALSSAEFIVGKQENCATIGVNLEDEIGALGTYLERTIAQLDTRNGLVIVVDLIGGTPMNLAAKELLQREAALLVTGLNMPLLMELFLNRQQSLSTLEKKLREVYHGGLLIKSAGETKKGVESHGDQIL